MQVAATIGVYAATAIGLNIVVGLAGLLDLGYVAFLGIGAFVAANLSGAAASTVGWNLPFPVAALIAAAVAGIFGAIVGSPTLRVRGDYLAIVTLAFGEIFYRTAQNDIGGLTGGSNAIPGIPPIEHVRHARSTSRSALIGTDAADRCPVLLPDRAGGRGDHGGVREPQEQPHRPRLDRDPRGRGRGPCDGHRAPARRRSSRSWSAPRSPASRARSSRTSWAPRPHDSFKFLESVTLLAAVILGGMGTIPGAVLGASLLFVLPEKLREFEDYRLLVFGLALIFIMRFRPQGLVPDRVRRAEFAGETAEGKSIEEVQEKAVLEQELELEREHEAPSSPKEGRTMSAARHSMSETVLEASGVTHDLRWPDRAERRLAVAGGGPHRRPDRPERRRQDHVVQLPHRAVHARPAARSGCTARSCRTTRPR